MAAEIDLTLAGLGPLSTPRLDIRPLGPADAEALRAVTDDPAITDLVTFLRQPFTFADALALIARADGGCDLFLGVWERASGALAGTVGVHLRGEREIEIGYWVGRGFQGRGYATEATGFVVEAVRRLDGGRRIMAHCRTDNRASWRVLERLGFAATGETGSRPDLAKLVLGEEAP